MQFVSPCFHAGYHCARAPVGCTPKGAVFCWRRFCSPRRQPACSGPSAYVPACLAAQTASRVTFALATRCVHPMQPTGFLRPCSTISFQAGQHCFFLSVPAQVLHSNSSRFLPRLDYVTVVPWGRNLILPPRSIHPHCCHYWMYILIVWTC